MVVDIAPCLMPTIKLILDQRRIKSDGTYPIKLRIFHQHKALAMATNISVACQYWNEGAESVKKSYPNHELINQKLLEIKNEAIRKILEIKKEYPQGYDHNVLFNQFRPGAAANTTSTPITLLSFWEEHIQRMTKAQQYGNLRTHKITLDTLRKQIDLNVPFDAVNYSFLKNIETILLERSLKVNTISVYLRALRAVYNQAINNGVITGEHYPFKAFKIKSERAVPHILPLEELRRLFHLDLPDEHPLHKTLLLAQLSFLLGGINFTDLCRLTPMNINNGRIIYTRSKTKKIMSIILLPQTTELLHKINSNDTATLCAVLNASQLNAKDKLPYIIRDKNKQFNKKLLRLSKLINSPIAIRSYTFRYTLANLCKKLGYDISLISELLGHSYGMAVTTGYLQAYDKDQLDNMLRHVIQVIYSPGE